MSRLITKRKPASLLYQKTITTLGDVLRKQLNPFSINPDWLFFADLHLHDRKEFSKVDVTTGLNTRLAEGLNIVDQVINICNTHSSIKVLFHLGDVFERKDNISNQILIEFQNRIKHLQEGGTILYLLEGNHDFNLPNYPTLSLFDHFNLVHFISTPSTKLLESVYFIPFQREWKDFEIEWNKAHEHEPDIICIHQDIPDGTYESGKPIPGQWTLKTNPKILYLAGHLHKPQKVHGIQFLGGPYQIKFSDEGQDRYIWLFNSKTKELQPLQLNSSKFISLEYYDLDIPKVDQIEEIVKNNYIRIIGEVNPEDINPKIKKTIKENLIKLGAKVVIFQIKFKHQIQTELSQDDVKDDIGVIHSYAEQNIVEGLDLDRLKNLGKTVYESL